MICVAEENAALFAPRTQQESASARLQQAFAETFSVRLGEITQENAPQQPAADALPAVPVRNLHRRPQPRWLGIDLETWQWTILVGLFFLVVFLADAARLIYRRYNTPEARRRREARRVIMEFLEERVPLDDTISALKCHFGMPQGTTLHELAAHIQKSYPALADACRELETARFSSDGEAQATVDFRRALRKAFAVFAVCLTSCMGMKAFSDWSHAEMLAGTGKPAEALEAFLDISRAYQSSPELSENIATLLAVLPPELEEDAESSVQAWRLHARLQRSALEKSVYGILPEHVLPLIAPLAILSLLTALHHRRRACVVLALAFVGALTLFIIAIRPRWNLKKQVVVTPLTNILLAPDADSPIALTLEDAQPISLMEESRDHDGYVFVRINGGEGWIKQSQILKFK